MERINTEKSKRMFERAQGLVAGGVSSKSRSIYEGYAPYPLFIDHASGSRLYDIDGNEYIDFLAALGATVAGNANPEILDFVEREMRKGTHYALPFELQLEVAEKLIKHVPSFERVSFVNSGTEADQMNIRLARAYSGKNLLLKFEGHYHGWLDNTCFSLSGTPEDKLGPKDNPNKVWVTAGMAAHSDRDIITIPWNDVDVLEKTVAKYRDNLGAIITEPYMCNSGCIPPKEGYLEALRAITRENNIVLIFDEVITGFRVGLNCAQGKFKVTPDLTTVGKAIGAGFPIAAYGGRKEIMDLIEKDKVLRAGTLNANRVVIAAAHATLSILERNNGEVYDYVYRLGTRMMSEIRKMIGSYGIKAVVQGLGPMFQIFFTDMERIENSRQSAAVDMNLHRAFIYKLRERGILVRPAQMGEFYVTMAHTDKDIDAALNAVDDAFKEMKKEGKV